MKHFQDTETGQIYAFENHINPFELNNRNIPTTLSENVIPKPDESHVWHQENWVHINDVPEGYTVPVSSVPSYNPAWMVFLHPYTAILKEDNSFLQTTLDQINNNTYLGNKLSEVVTHLDFLNGLKGLVTYDGSIGVKRNTDFPDNYTALEKFNDIFCRILIGGIHVKVLHLEDILAGSLQDKTNLFCYTPNFHSRLRHNQASSSERLPPLMHPRKIYIEDLKDAYATGNSVIANIQGFTPFFLLNGYSAMIEHNDSNALINLWTSIEQLVNYLWVTLFLPNEQNLNSRILNIKSTLSRRPGLDKVFSKIRLLRLSRIINKSHFNALEIGRTSRNDLVHNAIVPSADSIDEIWKVIPYLLELASGTSDLKINNLCRHSREIDNGQNRTNFDEWDELSQHLEEKGAEPLLSHLISHQT